MAIDPVDLDGASSRPTPRPSSSCTSAGSITPAIDEIAQLCAARGVDLVEDAAHAHGSALRRAVGRAVRHGGRFSFYPTKVIAGGEGGMIVTDDDDARRRGAHLP